MSASFRYSYSPSQANAASAPEDPSSVQIAVSPDDRLQDRTPVAGAGYVTFMQKCPLQGAKLIEREHRMIARAAEVALVRKVMERTAPTRPSQTDWSVKSGYA